MSNEADLPFDANGLSRIEDAGLNASAPPQQLWLDGWLVRFSPGKAKRARCINAVAAGRLSVAQRLQQAQAVFDQAGLPLVVRITPFTQPTDLDDSLAAHGLQAFDDTLVLVGDLARMDLSLALPAAVTTVPAGSADYAHTVGALRGSSEEQQRAHAERMDHSPVPYRGWLLRRDGNQVLACGQYAREGSVVGLYDVFTAPGARNQGLALALCADLLRRAATEGATAAYLQVDAANAPALAVYRKLGFVTGYRYHYRTADPTRA